MTVVVVVIMVLLVLIVVYGEDSTVNVVWSTKTYDEFIILFLIFDEVRDKYNTLINVYDDVLRNPGIVQYQHYTTPIIMMGS